MNNLIDLLKDQLSDVVMDKVAGLVGLDGGTTSSAITSMLPSLLGMIMDRGSTSEGASGLMSLITDNKLGGGVLDNLGDILGGGERSSNFMSMGSALMSSLLGSDQQSAVSQLSGITNLSEDKTSGLMSLLGPIAMSQIGKVVSDGNLDAGGLMSLFGQQKSGLMSLIPAGFSLLSNFMSDAGDKVSATASAAADAAGDVVESAGDAAGAVVDAAGDVANSAGRAARDTVSSVTDRDKGKGPWMWLIPLLLALLAVWWYIGRGAGDDKADVKTGDKTEMKGKDASMSDAGGHSGHDHDGHDHSHGGHSGHDHGGDKMDDMKNKAVDKLDKTMGAFAYRIDSKGNIVDPYGFIVYDAKQVKKDKDGNIIGPDGKILIPANQLSKLTLKEVGTKSPKLSVNKDGDLVDGSGKVLYKKGTFSEENGYYVDAEGKRIGFFKKIGNAIGDAAGATADAFKGVFNGIFGKKTAAAGTTHKLKRMEFNTENHRIEKYSKKEIEGLVAALKEHPDAKIDVLVHTDDGKNAKENKSLSQKRAEVVHNMMVTLGLSDKQVGFKGMGSEDEKKANKDVVEILVK